MTTPRDAIGLSERLRAWGDADLSFLETGGIAPTMQAACGEAATQLDALQERVKELEAEQEALVREIQRVNSQLADEMKRATRSEQERDDAYEQAAKEAESHCYGSTGRAIAKHIRQIAAGPEKEKK